METVSNNPKANAINFWYPILGGGDPRESTLVERGSIHKYEEGGMPKGHSLGIHLTCSIAN